MKEKCELRVVGLEAEDDVEAIVTFEWRMSVEQARKFAPRFCDTVTATVEVPE